MLVVVATRTSSTTVCEVLRYLLSCIFVCRSWQKHDNEDSREHHALRGDSWCLVSRPWIELNLFNQPASETLGCVCGYSSKRLSKKCSVVCGTGRFHGTSLSGLRWDRSSTKSSGEEETIAVTERQPCSSKAWCKNASGT